MLTKVCQCMPTRVVLWGAPLAQSAAHQSYVLRVAGSSPAWSRLLVALGHQSIVASFVWGEACARRRHRKVNIVSLGPLVLFESGVCHIARPPCASMSGVQRSMIRHSLYATRAYLKHSHLFIVLKGAEPNGFQVHQRLDHSATCCRSVPNTTLLQWGALGAAHRSYVLRVAWSRLLVTLGHQSIVVSFVSGWLNVTCTTYVSSHLMRRLCLS